MVADLDIALQALTDHLAEALPGIRWTREVLGPHQVKAYPTGCVICTKCDFRDAEGAGAEGALTIADVRLLLYLQCSKPADAQTKTLAQLRALVDALGSHDAEIDLKSAELDQDEENDRLCGLMLTMELTV